MSGRGEAGGGASGQDEGRVGRGLTLVAYLRSRAAGVAVLVALETLVALVLGASRVSDALVLLVCLLVAGAAGVASALDYLRVRGFYRGLDAMADSVDNPRLLPELLDEPTFPEGRIAYDALRAVARSANDEVAESRRQLGEYRSYVETWVHEAKSPLAAAHLALENIADDPAALACEPGRLRALDDELRRVEGYVEQALFYARSETVERDYLVRRHVLRDVVSAALRANAGLLIGAHVTPRLGDGLDLAVFTDGKWLEFMLGQLLQNSARYAREDGAARVWLDARVVREGSAEESVELEVRDNGCGVSPADLPRVFERGFTGENGRTHKRSTGLGLWLVARLAGKMGLSVRADSAEGEGFAVTLGFPTNKMHYFEA